MGKIENLTCEEPPAYCIDELVKPSLIFFTDELVNMSKEKLIVCVKHLCKVGEKGEEFLA